MAKTKVLVTGASGQLGNEICNTTSSNYEFVGITRKDAEIGDYKQVITKVKKVEPKIIIHCAAMTDVDRCEKEQELATQINTSGTRNVALAAEKSGAAIIYFSTDYVFDGNKGTAYVESDKPNPISHYGFTKLMGEKVIMEFHGNWTIIRTGWVYSRFRKNFVKSILASVKKGRGAVKVVDDQFGSPSWTKDIVAQTIKLIDSGKSGLFHAAGKGEISRYDFAKIIVNRLVPNAEIKPCATKDFPRPAKRPAKSTLQSERLGALGVDKMRPIEESLNQFLNECGEELLNEVPN